jgi:hypothetical protein
LESLEDWRLQVLSKLTLLSPHWILKVIIYEFLRMIC